MALVYFDGPREATRMPHSHAAPYVLSLDVGTSSVRAMVFDRHGRADPDLQRAMAHAPRLTADGGAEFDAEEVVQRAVTVLQQVATHPALTGSDVAAVGMSVFWHSLVGVDGHGQPVTPLYMWSDLRSASQARELRNRLDAEQLFNRTGCVVHPMYAPAKLLWLRQTQPERFDACQHWLSLAEYLTLRLFGQPFSSVSMASGTGLFDLRRQTWDTELLSILDVSAEQLGTLIDRDQALPRLRPEFERALEPLRACRWFPPVGDGACSNVGSGCVTETSMGLTVGTSGALRVITSDVMDPLPQGLWAYRLDRRRLIYGGAVNNAGNLYAWLRERWHSGPEEDLEAQLATLLPDAHGLTVLPFLAGERNPYWGLDTPAAIVGLRGQTRPVDIVHACLEAVAYRLALIYQRLRQVWPPERLLAGGGVLASPVWMQILADVLDMPITAVGEPEVASRGAALLALEALGVVGDVADVAVPTGQAYRPDPDRVARYRHGLRRHERLYQRLDGFLEAAGA
jgi:gluconokinase